MQMEKPSERLKISDSERQITKPIWKYGMRLGGFLWPLLATGPSFVALQHEPSSLVLIGTNVSFLRHFCSAKSVGVPRDVVRPCAHLLQPS